MGKWTRRALLTTGAVAGGGLLVGVGTVLFAPNRLTLLPDARPPGELAATTWVRIALDGVVTVLVPHCEMGQGAQTGLAMMLAEELDADWEQVRIVEAPAEPAYANGYLLRTFLLGDPDLPRWFQRGTDWVSWKAADLAGLQITGGSSSIRSTGVYGMRVAGAAARQMVLEAAAERWQVASDQLDVRDSRVLHAASGRSAGFGELAQAAATRSPPQHPALKAPADYRIVGSRRPRADLPDKVRGKAVYAIDVWRDGLLHAAIHGAPVPGGKLLRVDPAPALALPGVRQVIELADAVAVVADSYWRAESALRVLQPQFDDGGMGQVSSASLREAHRQIILATDGARRTAQLASEHPGARALHAEYAVPYLAHATMEPMCATAQIAEGRCEVWAGTQDPLNARHVAADAAGLPLAQVQFHNTQIGGGFGRRLPGCFDYIEQAVQIAARCAGAPVKLIWSREQDLRHDYYRSACMARFDGAVSADGLALGWYSHSTGPSGQDAAQPPYHIEHTTIRTSAAPQHLRIGSWRSVEFSQHVFFNESFVDELAHAAAADPLAFRLAHLRAQPRHRAVLERAAALAGWGQPLPAGSGQGIALAECFGSVCAQVAEVEIIDGQLHVRRVWAVVDCGPVIDPDQALAQIQGGILFGLSAALLQQITVEAGAVQQSSFPDYPSLILAQAPRIAVEFLNSDAPLGGLGEPGVPPVAPAVANAVFAATGLRLRSLPLQGALSAAQAG